MVFNIIASYSRAVIGAGLSLVAIRWVLTAMGASDFGIFTIVGSLIVVVTFVSSVMAGSASRHFAFAIGEGAADDVNRWFNTAMFLHLLLAVGLTATGWPIGELLIRRVLSIPRERLEVCVSIFRVSLIAAFAGMAAIPFVAMFNAKQRMVELALWGMLQSLFGFGVAYMLTRTRADKLMFYATGMVASMVAIQVALSVRALASFPECRVDCRLWVDRRRMAHVVTFAGWNLIGAVGMTLRDQGSALLLNVFFGPHVNASFGVATQVSTQANQLAVALLGAFTPEVVSSEGRGDRGRMIRLSNRACKFGTVLVLLFAVPLMVEMDFILKLWLHEPPAYSVVFCRLILLTFIIDRLTAGYMLAVNARGVIAGYQLTTGTIVVCTLPLAWILLKAGLEPPSVGVAFVTTMIAVSCARVYWMRRLFAVPVSAWLSTVVLPSMYVAIAASSATLAMRLLMTPSAVRLAMTCLVGIFAAVASGWLFALDSLERSFVAASVGRLRQVRS